MLHTAHNEDENRSADANFGVSRTDDCNTGHILMC